MIGITGATGQLGTLVVAELLGKVPAKDVVVIVRSPEKAAAWAAKGVTVRHCDYTKPETLPAAFAGVTNLLLISSSDFNDRAGQHGNAIDAAKKAGVRHIAYTSILKGPQSTMLLAADHIATEKALEASGVTYSLLRNGWYFENYAQSTGQALAHGTFVGSAQNGKIAAATRADFAAAAVAVLTTPAHQGRAWELGGDVPFTMSELAAEVAKQTGKPIGYTDLPPAEFTKILAGAGLPAPVAHILADCDAQIAKGALDDSSKSLSTLIGRPTTTLAAAVKASLAK